MINAATGAIDWNWSAMQVRASKRTASAVQRFAAMALILRRYGRPLYTKGHWE
jgi:hypothetical protein